MKLKIYNCSPRGAGSNSKLMSNAFAEGFCEHGGNTWEEYLIAKEKDFKMALTFFDDEGINLVVFPVYVDAMPGLAKEFIEALATFRGGLSGVRLLFLIHTGFPEETHTRPMARYLTKLSTRLGAPFDGIIRVGASEGIRHPDSKRGGKLLQQFRDMVRRYAKEGKLDEDVLQKLAGPKRLPGFVGWLVLPFVNYFGFGRELRRNGAYKKRFDRPL